MPGQLHYAFIKGKASRREASHCPLTPTNSENGGKYRHFRHLPTHGKTRHMSSVRAMGPISQGNRGLASPVHIRLVGVDDLCVRPPCVRPCVPLCALAKTRWTCPVNLVVA